MNLEIDESSAIKRFSDIYEALGIQCRHAGDIDVWNLRGHAMKLDQLVPRIINRVRDQHYDAIIIDPIYKVITGDENNATEMSHFCNQFDKLCADLGCAAIYCHHHSKGAQGAKRAIDRPSGSEVYARDPDALLDLVELTLSNDMKTAFGSDDATAFRLEASLREFPSIKLRNLWYKYPIHYIDDSGILDDAYAEGSPMANLSKSPKSTLYGCFSFGADNGNRTHLTGLGSRSSTDELYPRSVNIKAYYFRISIEKFAYNTSDI